MVRKLILGALFGAMPMTAQAASIVDTGTGPTNSGNGTINSATQWGLTSGQYLAAEFILPADNVIRTAEGYIGGIVSQTITIKVFSDAGDVPGAMLYSGSFKTAVTAAGPALWQGLSGLNWTLNAGTYWIGFEGTAPNSFAYSGYLNGAAPRPLGNEAFSVGGSNPYRGADSLDLSIRVTNNVTAPVPEPATWGLMILGLGAVGATMRYRRRGVRVRFA